MNAEPLFNGVSEMATSNSAKTDTSAQSFLDGTVVICNKCGDRYSIAQGTKCPSCSREDFTEIELSLEETLAQKGITLDGSSKEIQKKFLPSSTPVQKK